MTYHASPMLRTINDDKDCTVSRIDVSKSSINLSGSTAVNNSADKSTETLNKSAQSKNKLNTSHESNQGNNTTGSKRTHA